VRYDVIYTRYSSDMQSPDSCADQEREVRRALPRFGVDPDKAIVLKDEAQSGTRAERSGGFEKLCEMIRHHEVRTLAVDDQSRASRADNASQFIQDLVFAGGRFISTGEGIDTSQPGWELRVKVMEMHNSHTIRELGHRVRRGLEGRVRDDGSAGDFCFGYQSYFLDADWAKQLERRGPKPKKGLRISKAKAKWVRRVFAWFVEGRSMGWISRELTRLRVPKGPGSSKPGWRPSQVRKMLSNAKYIGRWNWGATTTIRNSQGRKKAVPVPPEEQVLRDRQNLRIIDQPIWDKAQQRLAELYEKFGWKDGQQAGRPKTPPTDVYPRSLLGGLLVCGQCGAKLWLSGTGQWRYYRCPNYRTGLCKMAMSVPASRAEQKLSEFLTDLLCSWPDWIRDLYLRARQLVAEAALRVPEQCHQDAEQLAEVERQVNSLVDALADGKLKSKAVQNRLDVLEEKAEMLQKSLDANQQLMRRAVDLPDDQFLAKQVCDWTKTLGEDLAIAATVLRQAFGRVSAHVIIAPGKKRGFCQLRFCVNGWDALKAVLGDRLPDGLVPFLSVDALGGRQQSPEFSLDLGQPTDMDLWGPQIVAWRNERVKWKEIVRRTGLDLNRAHIAWERHNEALGRGPDAA
jgi:site-specific DNA recombinase